MATRWTQADIDAVEARWKAFVSRPKRVVNQFTDLSPVSPTVKVNKRPKYGNRKVTDANGDEHASTKQFRRWQELQLRERAGEIRHLRREVPFALVVSGVLVCTYIADHVFEEGAATIVEDVKSPQTRKKPEYRIKLKLMQAIHGIQIREV